MDAPLTAASLALGPRRAVSAGRSDAWRSWWHDLEIGRGNPGPHVLVSRAIDIDGAAQPMHATPNREGYGYNAVQRVRVTTSA